MTESHQKLIVHETGVLKIADFGLSKSIKLSKPGQPSRVSMDGGGSRINAKLGEEGSRSLKNQESGTYKLTGETGSYR